METDNSPLSFQMSPNTEKLVAALAKAQGEIDVAVKDAENPHFKSSYADLASVWRACRAPLSKHGVLVMQWPVPASALNRVALITRVAHEDQWIQSGLEISVAAATAQALGSALTYLRRYMLASVAGVAPDDDDDGNLASAPRGSAAARQNPPPSPTEPQLKRLFAIAAEFGWTNEQIKLYMEAKWKIDSTRSLTREQYDTLCGTMQVYSYQKACANFGANFVPGDGDATVPIDTDLDGLAWSPPQT